MFDEANQYIIVVGNTTSDDWAPAANDHGMAYAVDLEGNWRWGKFFYNVSFAISAISGCQFDANGDLIVMGIGDSIPIVMFLDPGTGKSKNFISLEMIGTTSDNQPWYMTWGGIYHDTRDEAEPTKSFVYMAFAMNDYLHVLKINSAVNSAGHFDIAWNFQNFYAVTESDTTTHWWNKKAPRFLH